MSFIATDPAHQYLGAIPLLGWLHLHGLALAILIFAILGIDVMLTLVHVTEEFKGHLWGYFGGIVGVQVPRWLGVLSFTVLLTMVLWTIGFVAIAGPLVFPNSVSEPLAMGAMGALIGGRLSDGVFSHVRLCEQYAPNPGNKSVRYYFVEAATLTALFFQGMHGHLLWALGGFIIGVLSFYLVLPLLAFFQSRTPWPPNTPRPDWAW
jgi:hypothetical protein